MVLEQENRMKRVLGLFLALVMVFMICGNSVSVFASDFDKAVGVWKLVEMTGDDNLMSKEDVEAYEGLGIAMYLKLRDNGNVFNPTQYVDDSGREVTGLSLVRSLTSSIEYNRVIGFNVTVVTVER